MMLIQPMSNLSGRTGRDLLVIGATALDLDALPVLRDMLHGRDDDPLDVLVFSRGGSLAAAYRIALMIRTFASGVRFIVPDRCESAATGLILSGDEVVAGSASIFTPIDPSLHGDSGSTAKAGAVAAEDVRRFPAMVQGWFGLEEDEAKRTGIEVLCRSFFPPSLTALYRANEETRMLARALLELGGTTGPLADGAVDDLVSGYHSHGYPIGREALLELGLPIKVDEKLDVLTWPIVATLRERLGPGAVLATQDEWFDAAFAMGDRELWRRRDPTGRARWEARPE
jgi:hypothetical protein